MFLTRKAEFFFMAGFLFAAIHFVALRDVAGQATRGTTRNTLATAKVPASVKARIYRELNAEYEASGGLAHSVLGAFEVDMIRLSPEGNKAIRVWGSNGDSGTGVCGATGNCPVWVFDRQTGDLMLSADGWDFKVEPTIHHGRYDIVTRANMSSGTGVRDLYEFDGHAYQRAHEANEKYPGGQAR